MKRLIRTVVALLATAVALFALAEATQNRPDEVRLGSRTTVSFTVSTREVERGEPAAVAALWAVCAGTVPGEISTAEPNGAGWQVTIEPAIGEHGERRLVGCLEDVTVDRVIGRVLSIAHS